MTSIQIPPVIGESIRLIITSITAYSNLRWAKWIPDLLKQEPVACRVFLWLCCNPNICLCVVECCSEAKNFPPKHFRHIQKEHKHLAVLLSENAFV